MQAVLIAAGESSRFWPFNNGTHKSQMKLLGKSILYWTARGLADNGAKEILVVHAPNASIPAMLQEENDSGIQFRFIAQEKSLGTGNAVWQAREFIHGPFFLFWADKANSKELAYELKESGSPVALIGGLTNQPWDYGVFQFEGNRAVSLVENPEPGKEPSNTYTAGAMLLPEDFFSVYEGLSRHHEADLVDALNVLLSRKDARVIVKEKVPSLKYPWHALSLMEFTMHSSCFQPGIAASAQIAPTAVIRGDVHIGENAKVGEFTLIEGPAYIGEGCEIGSHNMLRGPLNLERGVRTGSFCELKNTLVQEGTHFHSGYIGDSVIGKNCRFGAGFVAANRRLDRGVISSLVKGKKVETGLTSFGFACGEESRFGIHSGTMPGVLIGSRCFMKPGSVIFQNVSDNFSL